MRIIYAEEKTRLCNTVVALGNFDGVHIAHRTLIEETVRIAKSNSLISVVYTFDEHPQKVLGNAVNVITLNSEKEKVLSELGVDVLVYQRPHNEFFNISPEEFVNNTIRMLGAKRFIIGEHYSFGKRASGNSQLFKKISQKCGVDTLILPLIYDDGELISSSYIRKLIAIGKLSNANKLLGREFAILGTVEHGKQIGRTIGFPTANIVLHPDKIVPRFGVYACKAVIEDAEYDAIVNIGIKPTFKNNKPLAEVHAFDVDYNFYDKNITLKLFEFIREEIKFNNKDELKCQIAIDIKKVKEYFSNNLK